MVMRNPWRERALQALLAGAAIGLALLLVSVSRAALGEEERVRILIDSPAPGVQVESQVHQARIAGNAIAKGDEPLYYDVMLAIDVSQSTKAASGVDVDGDGVVGVNPHMELLRRRASFDEDGVPVRFGLHLDPLRLELVYLHEAPPGRLWPVQTGRGMDLRGFGANFDEALAELVEIIGMQLGFADFKRQPEMVFHPAAPEYFALFAQVREDRLRATLAHQVGEVDSEYDIGGIPIPPAHVIEKQKKKFSLADA